MESSRCCQNFFLILVPSIQFRFWHIFYWDMCVLCCRLTGQKPVTSCSIVTHRHQMRHRHQVNPIEQLLDNKAHGANMGPTWGRQDPGGRHVGHVNLAIWESFFVSLRLSVNSSVREFFFYPFLFVSVFPSPSLSPRVTLYTAGQLAHSPAT